MSEPASQNYHALPEQVAQSITGIMVHYTFEYVCEWMSEHVLGLVTWIGGAVTWISRAVSLLIVTYVAITVLKTGSALFMSAVHVVNTIAVIIIQMMQVAMTIVPLCLF